MNVVARAAAMPGLPNSWRVVPGATPRRPAARGGRWRAGRAVRLMGVHLGSASPSGPTEGPEKACAAPARPTAGRTELGRMPAGAATAIWCVGIDWNVELPAQVDLRPKRARRLASHLRKTALRLETRVSASGSHQLSSAAPALRVGPA